MNIKLKDGEFFKNIIYSIKDLSETIDFYFDKDSLKIETIDMSQICVLNLNIHNHMFDHYDVKNKFSICLNINSFCDILKMSKKDSPLELKYTHSSDRLSVIQSGIQKGINFNIKLLKSELKRIVFGDIEYKYIVKLDSVEFEKIIKDALSISKSCSLTIKENKLEVEVNGDVGEGVFIVNNCEINNVMENGIKLNTEFLSMMAKSSKISRSITIKIDYDKPLCFEFLFSNPDTGENGGYLRYYLAHITD
jgi:proliferating cell nuclear antigen PCNA